MKTRSFFREWLNAAIVGGAMLVCALVVIVCGASLPWQGHHNSSETQPPSSSPALVWELVGYDTPGHNPEGYTLTYRVDRLDVGKGWIYRTLIFCDDFIYNQNFSTTFVPKTNQTQSDIERIPHATP